MARLESLASRELRAWAPMLRDALAPRFGDEASPLLDAIGARLKQLLADLPDPGWRAPAMRRFSLGGALYIAVYLELAARGLSAADAWAICEAATKQRFAAMAGFERKLASAGMFSWLMKAMSRWFAKQTRTAPRGDWVVEFVEAKDGFAYGVNYHRCAIFELAKRHGAAAFAPYICLSDIVGSEAFGWGLVRQETLAQGGARCDFRFRREGATEVKVRLPIVSG